jgi:hypothetical protein
MKRLLPVLLAALIAGMAGAFEPPDDDGDAPVKLKKRGKLNGEGPAKLDPVPPEEGDKDPPKGKKPEDPPKADGPKEGEVDPGQEEKEILERIERNMRKVEDTLANNELTEGTIQTQEDIVKDLERLLKKQQQKQNNQNQANGQPNPPPSGQPRDQQGKQGQQKDQANKKNWRERHRGNTQSQVVRGQQGEPQPQPGSGTQPGAGTRSDAPKVTRETERMFKEWGHLPPGLRPPEFAYSSDKQYLDKHREAIEKATRRMAEAGRKGD